VTGDRARQYLSKLADYERALPRSYDKATFGLERMKHLLAAMDHPEASLRVLQVGGTNGKGSVCAFADSILRHGGYRTGLATSPHLLDMAERIRVDGLIVPEGLFGDAVGAVAAAGDTLPDGERDTLTFFEVMIAAGLEAFRRAGVQIAVLEVGLGGRFDATSAATPDVVVITPVGRDHQGFLGETIEEIAADKAHLLRPGVPAVLGCAEPALSVFRARAAEVGAPILVLGEDFEMWEKDVGLPGEFQRANATLAVEATKLLAPGMSSEARAQALVDTRWPGRFQVVEGSPPIVLDGAMNPEAAAALGGDLTLRYPEATVALILGMSHDKRPAEFMAAFAAACPGLGPLLTTSAPGPRAMPARELTDVLRSRGYPAVLRPDLEDALEKARDSGADVACIAGSVYLVAEAMRLLGLDAEIVRKGP
jgi:dihydrofolate synthase/folylpolyglutamate synthase